MGVIAYETSGCHGVWLDRGEFEKIVKYLEQEVSEPPRVS
jgi:Zn-finger nucleic acid-binding protein